jgi:Ca-activated chloride channel family protein
MEKKTIILIDTSASMLTEDIRPDRFKRAIFLARHFIKKSHGGQFSIVLFSDHQKRIIPFTGDRDFLDSRLESFRRMNIQRGGSNISQAIVESLQYFKMESQKLYNFYGNILVLTDAGENQEHFPMDIPKEISLGVVAIGTDQGGAIPLRDLSGRLLGHKTYEGKKVISRVDESFLQGLEKKIHLYKYWKVGLLELPTKQIIAFFKQSYQARSSLRDISIRPVYTHYLVIVSIGCLIISVILGFKTSFFYGIFFLYPDVRTYAQKPINEKLLRETVSQISKLKKGKLDDRQRLKLAENFMHLKDFKRAAILYQETLTPNFIKDDYLRFNYATAMAGSGQVKEGFEHFYEMIKKYQGNDQDSMKMNRFIRNNVLYALKLKKSISQDKNAKGQSGGKEKQPSQKSRGKGKKKGSENQGMEKKQSVSKELKKQKVMGLKSMIRQIMEEDRLLQEMHMDTSTSKKQGSPRGKDW